MDAERSRLRLGDNGANRLHVDKGRKAFFFSTSRDESAVAVLALAQVRAPFAAKLDPSRSIFTEEILDGWLFELDIEASIPSVCSAVPLLSEASGCLIFCSAEEYKSQGS